MRKQSILVLLIVVLACHFTSMSFADTASFQGLGYRPNLHTSLAYGISADGLFVVGWGQEDAFRWSQLGGFQGLGDLPGGDFYGIANGASANGAIVVGYSHSTLDYQAFRWSESSGMQGLGDLSGGQFQSHAYGISDNGVVIVGEGKTELGDEAFRWTESTGMQGLGYLPGYSRPISSARAVSSDGSIIVGYSSSATGGEAFRWTESTGMQGLGDLPGGYFGSAAYAVSANGNVIVGEGNSELGFQEAVRWTEAEGMVGLGYLSNLPPPGYSPQSQAWDVSADGSIVVGTSQVSYGIYGIAGPEAFIWDEENGMRSIKEMLENDYGLNLTGWRLQEARGISNDGFTIVGYGISPGGNTQAWIATLPGRPSLLLHNPNGSESITAGTTYTISWSSMGSISNVLIEYSTNNGQDWNTVNPPNTGNTGSYDWSVPMTASQNCLIRIRSDAANSYISDISDNVFEIVIPKTITISSPNGGKSLISGGEQLIQWSSTGTISGVLIEQSFNNGQNWFPIEPANIGNSGSYEWFVPFANSNECLVRISDASSPTLYDISDSVFTIMQENPSEYPTLYEILGGSSPAITESGRDFVTYSLPDANVVAFILLESAGYANENVFGIYSAYDPEQKLQLFAGSDTPADTAIVQFNAAAGTAKNLQTGQTANIDKFFGFYLTAPQNGGTAYYTDLTRNPDSSEHGLIYNTSGFAGAIENDPDTVIAFEDLLGLGDKDYNDMVVGITNAVPLPGSSPHCTKQIPGDINGDCVVNLADFAIMVSHWLECNLDPQEACFSE